MLERELQDYLYEHPEILFPGEQIQEKHREFPINGRRIDLLFKVGNVRYIVELKRDTITREHLGQVMEYYGLMRSTFNAQGLRMILAAPQIPPYRKVCLEDVGIRCVEVTLPDGRERAPSEIQIESRTMRKRERNQVSIDRSLPPGTALSFDTFAGPSSLEAKILCDRMRVDTFEEVQRLFAKNEPRTIGIGTAKTADYVIHPQAEGFPAPLKYSSAGAWWGYVIGELNHVAKNNLPNISVAGMPGGMDLTINAEIQTSQKVMLRGLESDPGLLDALTRQHGGLAFQAWLKLEHQPRIYHWIPLRTMAPGAWTAVGALHAYNQARQHFPALKEYWVDRLSQEGPPLSADQRSHMVRSNQNLNLALRIVRSFPAVDPVWQMPYNLQVSLLTKEIAKIKPILEFFLDRA